MISYTLLKAGDNMAFQQTNIERNDYENNLLRLEKKYFKIIESILRSKQFLIDLLNIEKEISNNYDKYRDVWNLKNKLKIPVERLLAQHIYLKFNNIINGIFPSPVSSDIGFKTKDAIICIDTKTIDIYSNKNDLKYTQVESNQTSFDNKNFNFIKTVSNLDSIDHYSRLPVLTYVVKFIYFDNDYQFKLVKNDYPTMVLVSIPNGQLSKFFDYNIIENFKTYKYYDASMDPYYSAINLPPNYSRNELELFIEEELVKKRGYLPYTIDTFNKKAWIDPSRNTTWWKTSLNNKKVIAPVERGDSVRYKNEYLKTRYDDKNEPWDGYIEFFIVDDKLI